ncbi:hypothetical protein EIP86_009615 [Pleurotus ostreatoroseus]|nr:hypothetical protein EIP86_009615 [Pleurotus ostreatoroseus]
MSTSTPPNDGSSKASPPSSRPSSPSPSRFRTLARMGTALRRNSTGLLLNRQAVSRSASKSSLKSEPAQTPPVETTPETVPESPAREAAALEAENSERAAVGPSPLSREANATSGSTSGPQVPPVPSSEPVSTAAPAAPPAPSAAGSQLPASASAATSQPSQPQATPAVSQPPPPVQTTPQPDAPVAQSTPQPVVQTIPQPVAQPEAQPVAQPVAQPAAQPAAQPTAQPVARVATQAQAPAQVPVAPIPQAVIVPVIQPVVQPIAQPVAQLVAQPPTASTLATDEPATSRSVVSPDGSAPIRVAIPIEERGPDYFAWNNIPITMKKPSTSSMRQSTQEVTFVEPSEAAPRKGTRSEADPYAADSFAWGNIPVTTKKPSTSSMRQSTQEATLVGPSEAAPRKTSRSEADPYAADSFAWKDEKLGASRKSSMDIPRIPSQEPLTASPKPMETALPPPSQRVVSPKQSTASLARPASREQLAMSPPRVVHELSPKPSKSSIASSYGQVVNVTSGGRRFSVSIDPNAEPARGRSRSRSSIRVSFDDPYTDPFADPPTSNELAIPKTALSPIYSVDTPMVEEFTSMPKPMTETVASKVDPQPIAEEPEELHEATPVQMPLPDLSEVVRTNVVRQKVSAYSIGESSGIVDHAPQDTDERLPLLRRMPTPSVPTVEPTQASTSNGIMWPSVHRKFEAHGWSQHILPDSTVYFFHSEMRVATDIDLRNDKKVETVMLYLTSKPKAGPVLPPPGWELWLRDAGKGRYDFTPIRGFISHDERVLTFDMPHTSDVSGLSEDDRLDSEYRYWSYLESHPAHAVLPQKASSEAMDALRWCYAALHPSRMSRIDGAFPLFWGGSSESIYRTHADSVPCVVAQSAMASATLPS